MSLDTVPTAEDLELFEKFENVTEHHPFSGLGENSPVVIDQTEDTGLRALVATEVEEEDPEYYGAD